MAKGWVYSNGLRCEPYDLTPDLEIKPISSKTLRLLRSCMGNYPQTKEWIWGKNHNVHYTYSPLAHILYILCFRNLVP